jgi:carbamoyl-phosphate synthase large subunit
MTTSQTTVLVTGIGGSIGIDVARSLRRDPSIRLVGADGSPWGRRLGARLCDEVAELPRADRDPEGFLAALDRLVAEAGVDFSFVNPDPELEALGRLDQLPTGGHAVPPAAVTAVCLDKAATVAAAGPELAALFPATRPVASLDELPAVFEELAPPLWLRATIGPGGRGSLPVEEPEEARSWIRYWQRRGRADRWVAQELLPGRNFNWTGLYAGGELVVTAAMERLRYFLAEPAVSGVSGQVALCATVAPQPFRSDCDRVVRALDPRPHGLYSVDLREDREGRPRVTEVNPRLAGRPWLYSNAGINLPLAAVRALRGEDPGDALAPEGLEIGVHLYRQLDVEPVFDPPRETAP